MFYVATKKENYASMVYFSQTTGLLEMSMSYHRINPYDFFNGGRLSGTITTKNVPNVGAKIVLYESSLGGYIDETLTNNSGYFEFLNLDKNQKFHIMIVNNDPAWEHRTISRLSPE